MGVEFRFSFKVHVNRKILGIDKCPSTAYNSTHSYNSAEESARIIRAARNTCNYENGLQDIVLIEKM